MYGSTAWCGRTDTGLPMGSHDAVCGSARDGMSVSVGRPFLPDGNHTSGLLERKTGFLLAVNWKRAIFVEFVMPIGHKTPIFF